MLHVLSPRSRVNGGSMGCLSEYRTLWFGMILAQCPARCVGVPADQHTLTRAHSRAQTRTRQLYAGKGLCSVKYFDLHYARFFAFCNSAQHAKKLTPLGAQQLFALAWEVPYGSTLFDIVRSADSRHLARVDLHARVWASVSPIRDSVHFVGNHLH